MLIVNWFINLKIPNRPKTLMVYNLIYYLLLWLYTYKYGHFASTMFFKVTLFHQTCSGNRHRLQLSLQQVSCLFSNHAYSRTHLAWRMQIFQDFSWNQIQFDYFENFVTSPKLRPNLWMFQVLNLSQKCNFE